MPTSAHISVTNRAFKSMCHFFFAVEPFHFCHVNKVLLGTYQSHNFTDCLKKLSAVKILATQVIFSNSCPSQWVYQIWIWSFLTADIFCHSQDQMRKWSSEENVSGMSLFGSSWFKLDWEELKSCFLEQLIVGFFCSSQSKRSRDK